MNFTEYEKLIDKYADNHRQRAKLWNKEMSPEEFSQKMDVLIDKAVDIKVELFYNYPLTARG